MIYFFKKTQNLHFLKSTVYSWSVPLCLFRIKCITQKNNALNILCTICFCYCSIIIIFPISTIKMIFSFLWSNFILKVILSIRSHTLLWGYLLGCFIWNTESLKSQFSWAGCSHITASLSNSECRVILVQCPNFTPLKKIPWLSCRLEGETVHSQYRQDFTTEAPHVGNVDEMFKEDGKRVWMKWRWNSRSKLLLVNSNRKWMFVTMCLLFAFDLVTASLLFFMDKKKSS